MSARVDVLVNQSELVSLAPGSMIGRSPLAALRVNDPAISEAHALVSLRGTSLKLLSLRGRFVVAGQRVGEVLLSPGVTVELASTVALEVVEVHLPATVPALRIDEGAPLVPPPVASLTAASSTPLTGLTAEAHTILWVDEGRLHLRRPGEADRTLAPGDVFQVGPHRYEVTEVPLAQAATDATRSDPRYAEPLSLVVRFDTVHVWRGDQVVTIDGIPGRIVSELALMGAPVEWRTVAREIWPEESDDRRLRMNWDAGLARLRLRLRETRLRGDLIRSVGAGLVELLLAPGDSLTDET